MKAPPHKKSISKKSNQEKMKPSLGRKTKGTARRQKVLEASERNDDLEKSNRSPALKMSPLSNFSGKVKFLFTDIDDTLTDEGRLSDFAYQALWNLHRAGVHVIPVTGRPAGWCEAIARQWPVRAVIGENGAFVFYVDENKKMNRLFFASILTERSPDQIKLLEKSKSLFSKFPGTQFASDQFSRLVDVAIDFREDVDPPLSLETAQKIKSEMESWGAIAKVSSIHVNAWMGEHDKLKMVLKYLETVERVSNPDQIQNLCAFVGDSPNDEPMWKFFRYGFSVGPLLKYKKWIEHFPTYSTPESGGTGFVKISNKILKNLEGLSKKGATRRARLKHKI